MYPAHAGAEDSAGPSAPAADEQADDDGGDNQRKYDQRSENGEEGFVEHRSEDQADGQRQQHHKKADDACAAVGIGAATGAAAAVRGFIGAGGIIAVGRAEAGCGAAGTVITASGIVIRIIHVLTSFNGIRSILCVRRKTVRKSNVYRKKTYKYNV